MNKSLLPLVMLAGMITLFTGCGIAEQPAEEITSKESIIEETPMNTYGVVHTTAPVFNKPVFGELVLDDWGTFDPMAFNAYAGTALTIHGKIQQHGFEAYGITTNEYPADEETLYIDARYVNITNTPAPERNISLPSKESIISGLRTFENMPYIWGGNNSQGLPMLREYLSPNTDLSLIPENILLAQGVDCSGLLWEVTNGYTPRNTSELLSFGTAVDIEGKTTGEIISSLEPLDIIVWKGHNIIVLPEGMAIESRWAYDGSEPEDFENIWDRDHGVKIHSLEDVFTYIIDEKQKTPVNDYFQNTAGVDEEGEPNPVFVVRRWYPS